MDAKEFKQLCKDLGHDDVTQDQIDSMFKKIDKDNNSLVDWEEFLELMVSIKGGGKAGFGTMLKTSTGAAGASVAGAAGTHTYLLEERSVFCRTINKTLKDD